LNDEQQLLKPFKVPDGCVGYIAICGVALVLLVEYPIQLSFSRFEK
jgi:hypothetical protein